MSARPSPYVGLVPYSEADAALFFGREREQRIIAANLRAARLTLLYGASGVGKSSVLLAGVVPELRALVAAGRASAAEARNGRRSLAVADRAPLAVTVFRDWRDPPLPRLAEAIRAAVIEACGDDDVDPWTEGEPLASTLREYTARVRTLLVILDQFEEYFLYHPDERGPGTFDHEFPAIANDIDLRVHFMLSLREDAWSRLDRFKGRIPDLFGNYLRVDYLDRDAARRAVTEPVAAYNRALGDGAEPATIEDALVEAVLDEVRTGRLAFGEAPGTADGGRPRGDRVETPYLQLVMERLWEAAGTPGGGRALTLRTLEDLGGAEAIVSGHLSEAMASLSAADQDVAAAVFQYLVTPSKTKIAHPASDLAFWAKRPEEDVRRVLDQLAGERRILRALPPPPGEDAARYEIFHDVLAEAVLEWRGRHEATRERAELATRLREEERARRKARRDRLLRRLAVVLGVAILVLAVVLVVALRERSRSQAEERRQRSVALANAASGQVPIDPERALLIARRAIATDETPDAIAALGEAVAASRVRASLGSKNTPRPCRTCAPAEALPGWTPPPAALAPRARVRGTFATERVSFTPDGRTVVAAIAGRVRVWTPETGDVRNLPDITDASAARVTPDGRHVLVVRFSGRSLLAPLDGGDARPLPGAGAAAAVSADGRLSASVGAAVTVRRTSDGRRLKAVSPPRDATEVEFSPRDPELLLVNGDHGVTLWRWRTGAKERLARASRAAAAIKVGADALDVAFAPTVGHFGPDGRSVAIVSAAGRARTIRLRPLSRRPWTRDGDITRAVLAGRLMLTVADETATVRSARTGRALGTLVGHTGPIAAAAFSADERLVATGSTDGTARLWDARRGTELIELRGHGAAVTDLAFSPDGRRLLTDGDDGSTRLWDIATGDALPLGQPASTGPGPDGKVLVVTPFDGSLLLWDPATGTTERLAFYGPDLIAGAFAPGGREVALGGYSPSVGLTVVDVATREARHVSPRRVDVLAFDPDGRRLFTVSPGRGGHAVGRVWDAERWLPLSRIDLGTDAYTAAAFGPGDRIMLAAPKAPVRIVDLRTGETTVEFRQHFEAPGSVRASQRGGFSPDGKDVVTAGVRQALVWSPETGRRRLRLRGHAAPINDAAFSPDGRWIATGSEDRTVRIWDARSGRPIAALENYGSEVAAIAFTPDSRRILTSGVHGTVRLYPCVPCAPLRELKALAKEHATRRLNREERITFLGQEG